RRVWNLRGEHGAEAGLALEPCVGPPFTPPHEFLEGEKNLEPRHAAQPAMTLQLRIERAGAGEDGARQDVLRRALEEIELLHLGGDLRDELHRAGAVADHRDGLAVEVDVVAPGRGMELRALEAIAAGKIRDLGAVEEAH